MTSERECIQRTYTAEQVAQILGISLRKAYGLCETTTQFKVMRLGKRCLRIHKESGTVKYYAQIHLQVWQNSVCTGQGNLPLIT